MSHKRIKGELGDRMTQAACEAMFEGWTDENWTSLGVTRGRYAWAEAVRKGLEAAFEELLRVDSEGKGSP